VLVHGAQILEIAVAANESVGGKNLKKGEISFFVGSQLPCK